MKFALFFIAFAPLSLSSAFAQEPCLLVSHQSLVNDKIELDDQITYNDQNKILESRKTVSTSYGDTYTTRTNYEYDNKGFLEKKTEYKNDNFIVEYLYAYDGRGNLISTTENTDPNRISLAVNKLLAFGNRTEKSFFGVDGSLSGKEVKEKNGDDKLILYQIINGKGVVNHSSEYKYTPDGQISYKKNNDVVGHMLEETYSKFDADKHLIADSTFLNGKMIAKTVFDYEGNNKVKLTRYGRNNQLDYVIEYEYDARGNNTSEKFFYKEDLVSTNKRQYDAQNNLIKEDTYNQNNQLFKTQTWVYNCLNY